jgi:hypothetical protein
MKTVRFETADAVFQFTLEDVVEMLKGHASEDEATELLDFLPIQRGDIVEIPQGKKSFLYAVLDLLTSNKGTVFCKICGREYQANELIAFSVGAGENPLKVKVGYRERLLKRLFGRQRRVPLLGGVGYRCPQGHEVISLVTWRT